MEEIWKPVGGFEGLYEVSTLGNVRSLDRRVAAAAGSSRLIRGRVKQPSKDGKGYLRVNLFRGSVGGVRQEFGRFVHRLVAEAFLGSPGDGRKVVNHINFIRDDNRAENLEWVSTKENLEHSSNAGRMLRSEPRGSTRFTTPDDIKAIRDLLRAGSLSYSEIAKAVGVGVSTVSDVASGRSFVFGEEKRRRLVASSPWEQAGRRRKLQPTQVVEIASLRGTASAAKVGAQFGVSAPTVWGIWNGKYWKSVITSPA